MLRATIYTVCVGLALASAASADVYKYKDEKGNVLYTDRPSHLPAERLNVQSQRSDIVEIEKRTAEDTKASADRARANQQDDKAKADQQKAIEGKAEACNKARQDYLARMNARVYEDQPNGERRFLNEAEMAATRAAAKQAMDALCN